MARENETYRLELEEILKFFGNKRILTVRDISNYLHKDPKWVRKHLGADGGGMTAVTLAFKLSHM